MGGAVLPAVELQGRLLRAALEASSGVTADHVEAHFAPRSALAMASLAVSIRRAGPMGEALDRLEGLAREAEEVAREQQRAKDEFSRRLSAWKDEQREQLQIRIEEETRAGQIEAFLETACRARLDQFDAFHRGPALRAIQAAFGVMRGAAHGTVDAEGAERLSRGIVEAVATSLAMGITLDLPRGQDLQMASLRDRILAMVRQDASAQGEANPTAKAQEERLMAFLATGEEGALTHPKMAFLQAPFPELLPASEAALSAWEGMVVAGVLQRVRQFLVAG